MGIINPGKNNVFTQNSSEFEETPEVKENLNENILKTFEQIKKGDLGVPSHALKAGAFQYAKVCEQVNKEFRLCKMEEGDPRRCLAENIAVADCAEDFFVKVSNACTEQFVNFTNCLEHNIQRKYMYCRPEQSEFDHCLFDKLGMDKIGLQKAEDFEITTDRPAPINPLKLTNYDEPQPLLPDFSRPINYFKKKDE